MLLTNGTFSTMQPNKKPEATNFGLNELSLRHEENTIIPIVAESENLYKTDFAMSQRFIKFIPGEKADWLRKNHIYAFVLLSVIAERARRTVGHIDGFEIGWALLGDYESVGLTRQNYRTALDLLESYKIIEILYKGKKDKKSTINPTIKRAVKGTIVKLCDSSIWDINLDDDKSECNHQSNHQVTITQPSSNHEQERIKKEERIFIDNSLRSLSFAPTAKSQRRKDDLVFSFEKKSFEGLTDRDFETWKKAYPEIDIEQQISQATEWILANPGRSQKTLWRKFLTGWFSRANEKIANRKAYSNQGILKPKNNRDYVLERFKHYELYNNAYCYITEHDVTFERNMKRQTVKFSESGFNGLFEAMLNNFGIK